MKHHWKWNSNNPLLCTSQSIKLFRKHIILFPYIYACCLVISILSLHLEAFIIIASNGAMRCYWTNQPYHISLYDRVIAVLLATELSVASNEYIVLMASRYNWVGQSCLVVYGYRFSI